MSVGKYNFLSDKIECSWTYSGEIKTRWISQNQLIEYERPQFKRHQDRAGSFWQRDHKM